MASREETLLELPWEVADSCNGFGMDFGGTVLKTVYLHKDDWSEPERRTTETVKYRVINFSREEFQDALNYLKERVFIRRKNADDKPIIYTCGIGGSQYATEIRENFNIRTANISEMECMFAAFPYLLKTSKIEDLRVGFSAEEIKAAAAPAHKHIEMVNFFALANENFIVDISKAPKDIKFTQEIVYKKGEKFSDLPGIFPCLYVLGGSSGCIMLINENGKYQLTNEIHRVGKDMMGKASLLTGCKTFEEFMSLAEKGNMHNIHEYVSDFSKTVDKSQDSFYTNPTKHVDTYERPTYLFGKCVFKDLEKFRKEDIAASLLWTSLNDYAQVVHTTVRCNPEVKHVFFCGGFTSHPLAQQIVLRAWLQRELEGKVFYGLKEFSHTYFMKHGQHLGAVGSLLNQKLNFTRVKEETIK